MKADSDEGRLEYAFSSREVFLLAKFLRNHQDALPDGLENFYKCIEDAVYNSLSLEEALRFYS